MINLILQMRKLSLKDISWFKFREVEFQLYSDSKAHPTPLSQWFVASYSSLLLISPFSLLSPEITVGPFLCIIVSEYLNVMTMQNVPEVLILFNNG
jgi:hypothetical protein